VGIINLIAGLGFMGPGFGFFSYPGNTLMVGYTEWIC
jgi:hypothetical protein